MARSPTIFAAALLILSAAAGFDKGAAASLTAADSAWIDKCVADRAAEDLDPTALRKYCVCMQDIVEENAPLTPAELEHAYPPAHVMCSAKAGL